MGMTCIFSAALKTWHIENAEIDMCAYFDLDSCKRGIPCEAMYVGNVEL
jgi:hypothetical protein